MAKPLIKHADSFPVTIFIAGSYRKALKIAQKYCDEIGYCVTVDHTCYVYKGGKEEGIRVGLINYPRFPASLTAIIDRAIELAELLRVGLKQESYSIQTPSDTIWYSYRKEDIIDE